MPAAAAVPAIGNPFLIRVLDGFVLCLLIISVRTTVVDGHREDEGDCSRVGVHHPRRRRGPCDGVQFKNNHFTELCSGSEAGSYLRLIDLAYHSTLGLRVMKKKKDATDPVAGSTMVAGPCDTGVPRS